MSLIIGRKFDDADVFALAVVETSSHSVTNTSSLGEEVLGPKEEVVFSEETSHSVTNAPSVVDFETTDREVAGEVASVSHSVMNSAEVS